MTAASRLARWFAGLQKPTQRDQAAEDDARHLLEAFGPHAYREARSRARQARADRLGERDRHWSHVARVIAKAEGREVGLRTADRYGS